MIFQGAEAREASADEHKALQQARKAQKVAAKHLRAARKADKDAARDADQATVQQQSA